MNKHGLTPARVCLTATATATALFAGPLCGQAAASETHTLKHGETVELLSRRYHVAVKDILAANHLKPTDILLDGRSLYIPDAPHPTIVPSTMRKAARINGDRICIRIGPASSRHRLKLCDKGEALVVTAQRDNWLQVECTDGRTGWVRADFVRLRNAGSSMEAADLRSELRPANHRLHMLPAAVTSVAEPRLASFHLHRRPSIEAGAGLRHHAATQAQARHEQHLREVAAARRRSHLAALAEKHHAEAAAARRHEARLKEIAAAKHHNHLAQAAAAHHHRRLVEIAEARHRKHLAETAEALHRKHLHEIAEAKRRSHLHALAEAKRAHEHAESAQARHKRHLLDIAAAEHKHHAHAPSEAERRHHENELAHLRRQKHLDEVAAERRRHHLQALANAERHHQAALANAKHRHLVALAAHQHNVEVAARRHEERSHYTHRIRPEAESPTASNDVVRSAFAYRGTPYRWGSSRPGGFDCSGFTKYIYGRKGVSLPRTAAEQFHAGKHVEHGSMKPGDLVFFHTTRSGISHVGMYVGNGKFVHSSSQKSGGVRVDNLDSGYYNKAFRGARRVRKETNEASGE